MIYNPVIIMYIILYKTKSKRFPSAHESFTYNWTNSIYCY